MNLTDEQKKWLKDYEGWTMCEPMHLDELKSGSMTFNQVAKANIDWFENWTLDAFQHVSRHVPWDEDEKKGVGR